MCATHICEYKAKQDVCLDTHKNSMHKGDDPIKYQYINDLDDIKLNLYLDFKNLDKFMKYTNNLNYLYKI